MQLNHRLRGRRGARLVALTSGGAIPDNTDYRVVLEPSEVSSVRSTRFRVESLAGDIFQLGNTSWRILRINSGVVASKMRKVSRLEFHFGLRSGCAHAELSQAVSNVRVFRDEAVV